MEQGGEVVEREDILQTTELIGELDLEQLIDVNVRVVHVDVVVEACDGVNDLLRAECLFTKIKWPRH